MKKWMAAGVVLLLTSGWLLWHGAASLAIRSAACAGCNVLLITIDTLRSDRVGAFGGPADLTPTLDRLAAAGLRLTHAYSAAPLTLPSHASMPTGVSPPVPGVRANGLFRLGATARGSGGAGVGPRDRKEMVCVGSSLRSPRAVPGAGAIRLAARGLRRRSRVHRRDDRPHARGARRRASARSDARRRRGGSR